MKKLPFDIYVTIGSSAGGFEALSELVSYLPKDTGFFYFSAQHHAFSEKTVLAELLSRNTQLTVLTVEEETVFKPDILYILPVELKIIIENNKPKAVKADVEILRPHPNIDYLFETFSAIENSKTIAILLSGTGSDGTKGIQEVKELGGITIVQSPQEAQFNDMIKNAIDTGDVDYILNVENIAKKLEKLADAFKDGTYITQEIPFDDILKTLYKEKELDLFKYKEETIKRRIQKRMDILNISNIEEYSKYCKKNMLEIGILNQEVLIGVTEFFRGPEAFDSLQKKIKKRLKSLSENSEFRIWCIACSSGEEAYSLAIIVSEAIEELGKKINVKIFASDIDDAALDKARAGEYSASSLEQLKKEWIEKYFTKIDIGFKVKKKLREQIVFAHHDFLNNPPFINIDLISCRNIFIYLKSSVQTDLFSLFHYALNENGFLFLGSSESVMRGLELFDVIDNKNRIYKKRNEKNELKLKLYNFSTYTTSMPKSGDVKMQKFINPVEIEKYLQESIFDYFSNGSLIVDRDYTIVYKKGDIPYLNFSDGVLSLNLFDSLDKELHYEVRTLIKKVLVSNVKESSKFIQLNAVNAQKFIKIIVQPFKIPEQQYMILLSFIEVNMNELILNGVDLPSFDENTLVSTLSSQISQDKEQIQELSDELRFSKQNMSMINEELQNSNEKLQSTVEELETSNEELQASNEELQVSLTANKELQSRLTLILESSMDGIIGVDSNARHIFVNEKAAKMLGYSADFLIGKASHKLWHHTKPDGSYFSEDECAVTRTLKFGEESRGEDLFWRKDGTAFSVEVMRSPILENGKIVGAVMSFHDISEKKRMTKKSKADDATIEAMTTKYEQTFKFAKIGIAHIGLEGYWIDVNDHLCKIVGYSKKELLKLKPNDITHADDLETVDFMQQLTDGDIDTYYSEKRYIRKDRSIVWVNFSVVLVRDALDEPQYFLVTMQDISQIKILMIELELKKNKFENIIRFAPNPIMIYAEDGNIILVNEAFTKLTGYLLKDVPTIKKWSEKVSASKDIVNKKFVEELFRKNISSDEGQMKIRTKNGDYLIWLHSLAPLEDISIGKRTIICSATDITKMHENEEMMLSQSRQAAMGDMIGMIAHQWRQPLSVIAMLSNNLKADLEFGTKIPPSELEKLTDILTEQTQFLSRTIDDFRTFLKPQKEKEKVSICDIFEKLRNMIGKTLENNEITLNFVDECNVQIYTYTNELIQVFLNLLNNSKDAFKEHNIKNGKIDILTSHDKDLLTIEIKDNAGGIDKSVLNNLGEPYVSTKSKNGTGLGIYMSKMILQKHFDGTLKWKNCDEGSCFIIELPLHKLKKL